MIHVYYTYLLCYIFNKRFLKFVIFRFWQIFYGSIPVLIVHSEDNVCPSKLEAFYHSEKTKQEKTSSKNMS